MNDYLILTENVNPDYRIKVYYDIDASCPLQDWDMGAMHYLWHDRNCCISNEDESKDFYDTIRSVAADNLTQEDIIRFMGKDRDYTFEYDAENAEWSIYCKGTGYSFEVYADDLADGGYEYELLDIMSNEDVISLMNESGKMVVSYDDRVEDCFHTFSYITREMGINKIGYSADDWQEKSAELIKGEIKELDIWASGEVIGFELEKRIVKHVLVNHPEDEFGDEEYDEEEWEWVDSCWGYYLEPEDLVDEVIAEHSLEKAA